MLVLLLCVGWCLAQPSGEDLPPGVAYLRNANGGKGYEAFVEKALRESELFRRHLLRGRDEDHISVPLLARALERFCDEAPAYLKGRKGIDGFKLTEAEVRQLIEGKGALSAQRVYGGFTGKWYGKWDQMRVDHHWGEIVTHDPPRRIEMAGQTPVYLRSCQYCWVGDGYGINVIATDDVDAKGGDFLLGYVTHIRDGDMSQPTKSRPHVGVYVGPGQLIWITAGEVFLEESYEITPGVDAYAITGFFYRIQDGHLETTGCFQSHYTRDHDDRPAWFSFPLKLNVHHAQGM